MTSSRETVKPGINLLVSPEEDDPDRGVAKIKLLKAAFEDPDADIPWQQKKRFDDFDYGYALTVHKAQGSQWNEIVLFDESLAFKETRQRWLYTAITRAAERLTDRAAESRSACQTGLRAEPIPGGRFVACAVEMPESRQAQAAQRRSLAPSGIQSGSPTVAQRRDMLQAHGACAAVLSVSSSDTSGPVDAFVVDHAHQHVDLGVQGIGRFEQPEEILRIGCREMADHVEGEKVVDGRCRCGGSPERTSSNSWLPPCADEFLPLEQSKPPVCSRQRRL